MNRLFTFGCSFTRYVWPTWADILGKEFDYYENWAKTAAGNQFIFNSLIEANIRNNFSDNDTVIIMWSSIYRDDRYLNGKWIVRGEDVKKLNDNRGYLIRDLAIITSTLELLKYWKVKYHFLSVTPLDAIDHCGECSDGVKRTVPLDQEVIDLYASTIKNIKPSAYEVIFNFNWESRPVLVQNKYKRIDFHPLPLEHLEYIEKILPEYSISASTRKWAEHVDLQAKQLRQPYSDTWPPYDHEPKKRF